MNIKSVAIRPGVACMIFQQDGRECVYSGVWSFNIHTTDDTLYEIALHAPGRPDSLAGLIGLSNWDKRNKLLTMEKYEYPSRDKQIITPLPVEDVKQLKQVLKDVKDGRQRVQNQYGDEVSSEYRYEVMDFLEPRIEIGTQLLDHRGRVLLGQIEDGLRNQQEKPHLPKA